MGSDILYIFDDYFDPQNCRDLVDEEHDHEIWSIIPRKSDSKISKVEEWCGSSFLIFVTPIFFMSPKKGPLYKGNFIFQASCFRWHVSFIVSRDKGWTIEKSHEPDSWCLPWDFEGLLVQDIPCVCFLDVGVQAHVCFFPLV